MIRILLAILLIFNLSLSNAQVLNVLEIVENSNKKIPLGKYNIVDINSVLEIDVDKQELGLRISRLADVNSDLVSQLTQLNFVLEQQVAILKILHDTCTYSSHRKNVEILGNYSTMMSEFYDRLMKNDTLRKKADALFAEYFQNRAVLDKSSYPTPQSYVIQKLSDSGKNILKQIENSDAIAKINVQLVAFLNTKTKTEQRVHIENFDTYAAGEYYKVDRWVTSFSDEEIEAFQKTSVLAGQLNEIITNGFSGLNNLLSSNLPSYRCALNILTQLKNFRDGKDSLIYKNELAAQQFLTELQNEILSFTGLFNELSQSGDSLLYIYNEIRDKFISCIEGLPNEADSLTNLFIEQLEEVNQPVIAFKDSLVQFWGYLKTDTEKIEGMAAYVSNLFKPFKNSAETANAIGEEVVSFTIKQIPDLGIIDLKTTGMRGNSDELVLKLILNKNNDNLQKGLGETIEYKTITLQQVSIYSETKVSLILASPYNSSEKVKLENRFQFAPSGSVLFKFGSRSSRTWNYLNPGLGINMSTPDFDLDGTPDVAFGAVFSIMKDLAMVGWSYNIQTDSPFWFFGLSLPFSMPGAPVNTIQTKLISNN